MESPLTVAIPIFNGERFLGECIASLLRQSFTDFKLLCIDDGSADRSLNIVQSFNDRRIEVHHHDRSLGLAGNWNRCLALASSPFAVIAHQDDRYDSEFLAVMLRLIESHSRAFAAHSLARIIDEHGSPMEMPANRYKERFWPANEPYEREPSSELAMIERGNYIICPTVIYRMDAVRSIGVFNDQYRFVTDWEYWMRGLIAGFTIAGTHRRLIEWRRHTATATTRHESSLRRYEEELSLLNWLARTTARPVRLAAVENTVLSGFTASLAIGDREGAARIYAFAATRLPRSFRTTMMRAALPFGRIAGRALRLAESAYVRLARLAG